MVGLAMLIWVWCEPNGVIFVQFLFILFFVCRVKGQTEWM